MNKNIKVATKETILPSDLAPGDRVTFACPVEFKDPSGHVFRVVTEIEFINDDGVLKNIAPISVRSVNEVSTRVLDNGEESGFTRCTVKLTY